MAGKGFRSIVAVSTGAVGACMLASPVTADDSLERRVRAKAETVTAVSTESSGAVAEAVVGSPYSVSDPEGDAPPRADILEHSVKHTATKVKVDLRVRAGTDPFTDDTWVVGLSGPVWRISTDGDARSEYFAFFINDGAGTLVAYLVVDRQIAFCAPTPKFHDGNAYGLKIPRQCLGDPATIRVKALMHYDLAPYTDWGPEDLHDSTRFTPEVAVG
jgi:hypothetical protein